MKRVTYSNKQALWSSIYNNWNWAYDFHDEALVLSENHRHYKGRWLSGGPFFVRKRHYTFDYVVVDWMLNGVRNHRSPWIGTVNWSAPTTAWTAAQLEQQRVLSFADANAFGATGWKRARPGQPIAGVANMLGELKEGLPRLPHLLHNRLADLLGNKAAARRLNGKAVAEEHLNVQFGWIPLLSDIKKMYEAYHTIDKQLAQIYRDNGKGVHRRRTIRDSKSVSSSVQEGNVPFLYWNDAPANWSTGRSSVTTTTTEIDKIWFVGKFRYYIPDIGSSEWRRRTTARLYGANFTPEVAWNLLPWSWLFDWFGNVGDVISNASSNAVDNLTADYAYIMRTTESRTDVYASTHWNQVGTKGTNSWIPAGSAKCSAYNSTLYKTRVGASPFGFGLTFDGLSTYQLGIAAALGISRWT